MKKPTVSCKEKVRHYATWGFPFQALLVGGVMYGSCVYYFLGNDPHPKIVRTIGFLGMVIMAECMARIYCTNRASKKLITTGLFRYTRHPMYTGMAVMGIDIWWPTDSVHAAGYWISLAMFAVGIVAAAYMQEKETIARYGEEAEEYYRRTPRLFLLYPFTR